MTSSTGTGSESAPEGKALADPADAARALGPVAKPITITAEMLEAGLKAFHEWVPPDQERFAGWDSLGLRDAFYAMYELLQTSALEDLPCPGIAPRPQRGEI